MKQVVVFSFALVNGPTAQDSRAVSVSATGYYCMSNLCSWGVAVEIPAVFMASAKMLHIKVPTFETAIVAQSTTDPGQTATITVSLKANQPISEPITIMGLCGTSSNDQITFTSGNNDITLSGPVDNPHLWYWDLGTNFLQFGPGDGLAADTTYVVTFTWALLAVENAACDTITISAPSWHGLDGWQLASAPMTNHEGKVGKVTAPKFTTLKISQFTTRPDAENYICVTLETNSDFNSDDTSEGEIGKSTFTLSGLFGSQNNDEQSTTLYSCPTASSPTPPPLSGAAVPFIPLTSTRTPGTYDFVAATGSAVFVMDVFGFARGTEYTFAMRFTNSESANPCQTVTLAATSPDFVQNRTFALSSNARAIQDGEEDGDACPLTTYAPGFHTRTIAQDSKLAGEFNVITVTLRSNVDLSSQTMSFFTYITITGLTGTNTNDTSMMTDLSSTMFTPASGTNGSGTPFVPRFAGVAWTKASGVLRLRLDDATACSAPTAPGDVNTCIKAGFTYVFSFTLLNGEVTTPPPHPTTAVLPSQRLSGHASPLGTWVALRKLNGKVTQPVVLSTDGLHAGPS